MTHNTHDYGNPNSIANQIRYKFDYTKSNKTESKSSFVSRLERPIHKELMDKLIHDAYVEEMQGWNGEGLD